MSERFIKFIPSEESTYLIIHKPNAFRLLTIIATRARRENGHPDGLMPGQCYLGDYKNYGMSEQEYRSSKNILIMQKHVKIVETCRTRKKSTTGSTTVGTLVELISSTVYDINVLTINDRIDERPTTDQRRTRRKKKEKEEKEEHISACADKKIIDLNFVSEKFNNTLSDVAASETINAETQHNVYYHSCNSELIESKQVKTKQVSKLSKKELIQKIAFREKVSLTQEEYNKILDVYGKIALDWMLDKLNNQKQSTGKNYKSDYHTILNWVVEAYQKFITPVNTYQNQRKTLDIQGNPVKSPHDGRF